MNVMLTGELPNKRIAGGHLNKIISKCVELSPSGRYQSISQLQSVLDELAFKPAPVQKKNNWKKYLPPGFRNSNVLKWLFSAVGYAAMFAVGLDLQVENAGIVELIINRISFTAMCLCITTSLKISWMGLLRWLLRPIERREFTYDEIRKSGLVKNFKQ